MQGAVPTMMSVSLSNKEKSFEVETPRHQQSILSRNSGETHSHPTPAEERQKCYEDKVGRWIESMNGTQDASYIWQLGFANLICGESGSFRRGKHSAALFHNPNQDVRMALHGDNFECLLDDDGLITHRYSSQIQRRSKILKDSNLNNLCVVELWI